MIEEVIERLSIEGDAQRAHVGEIALRVLARAMALRKHHLPFGPVGGASTPDPALQGAELAVGQGPFGPFPQGLEDRPRLKVGGLDQQRLNLGPESRKGAGRVRY